MKKHVWLAVLAFYSAIGIRQSAFSQAPQLINYQGRLLQGTNLVNGTVGLSLRLFDAPTGGTRVYEDSNTVTVADGLYSTWLGDQTVAGQLDAALNSTSVWLEVAVDGVALAPRELLASVAYARQVAGLLVHTNGNVMLNPRGSNVVVAVALQGVIGGGSSNSVQDTSRAVIAGGERNLIADFADYSTIGGGRQNRIASGAGAATIAGGDNNLVSNNASYAAIPGGRSNVVGAVYGLAAGRRARALHPGAFVWGDATDADVASTTSNQVTFRAGGGFRVLGGAISGDASGLTNFPATVVRNASGTPGALSLSTNNSATAAQAAALGGALNVASGPGAVVAGGIGNLAEGVGAAVVGGGGIDFFLLTTVSNRALGDFSFVGGGGNNTATGRYSAVLGGKDNLAGGGGASVPGGFGNTALGAYSLAAGRRAGALHEGAFVWADAQDADFESTGTNQFLIRANGGLGLNTVAPSATLHVVGSATLGSLLVAPQELVSGDDAELVLAEDTTGNFAMRLLYDGGLNQFRIFGVENRTNLGPHLVVARDEGYVGVGASTPAAQLHVLGGSGSVPVLLVAGATSTVASGRGPAVTISAGRGGPGDIGGGTLGGTGGAVMVTGGVGGSGGLAGQGGDVVIAGGPASGFGVPGRVLVRGGTGLVGGPVLLAVGTNGAALGQVGIGTTNLAAGYLLSVGGTIRCEEVVVETGWADFVFDPGYALRPLAEVQRHIDEHGRLPDVPAAADVQARGIGVGTAQTILLQKVEELTLYLLQQQREIEALRAEVKQLRGEDAR